MFQPNQAKKLRIFCKHVGKGINRFDMIEDGDRLLIGVSGGKDSLALSMVLKHRLQWVPIQYELTAILIEWREFPLEPLEKQTLMQFYRDIGVPFRIVAASIHPPSFKKDFSCYFCSRNKKRILFQEAERLGIKKIVLGHNMDDHIETTLIELFFKGQFSTMMPVKQFFDGKMTIIRPMCEVKEQEIKRFSQRFQLPVVESRCPRKNQNQRKLMKETVSRIAGINRKVRENIYNAPWKINVPYLPISIDCNLHRNQRRV